MKKIVLLILIVISFLSCSNSSKDVRKIGFVDAFEDETIAQAKVGFLDALAKNGFSEKDTTLEVVYRNAQGDISALTQIMNYNVSQNVDLVATSTTLSTITAIQHVKDIPIFMMVSPTPERMKVLTASGLPPSNLFGVEEELFYIDTSFALIPAMVKPKGSKLVVGMIYNEAEPQSVDALQKIKGLATKLNVTVEALPVNNSADAQLVTQALLQKNLDAFFANPDNTVFAAFETILKNCNQKNVPIFTSESGLVKRGAVAAFGADIYKWGYQAGEQASKFLKTGSTDGLKIEMVKTRDRIYNPEAAQKYNIQVPANFTALK